MSNYKCLECEEEFEHQVNCIQHNDETKHEEYSINGSNIKFKVKS